MKKNKITVIEGTARLDKGAAAPLVKVKTKAGEDTVTAKHVILATGAQGADYPASRIGARRQAGLDCERSDGP